MGCCCGPGQDEAQGGVLAAGTRWKGVRKPATGISHILMFSIKNTVNVKKKTLTTADHMRAGIGQSGAEGGW